MNVFTSYDDVPFGAHIVRTQGKRKGWVLQRCEPEVGQYQGPTFYCYQDDSDYEDWDLPDDKHWRLMI